MKITEQNGLRVLTPDVPGAWLTNGETYSQKVYLAAGANPTAWYEISADEYARLTYDPDNVENIRSERDEADAALNIIMGSTEE